MHSCLHVCHESACENTCLTEFQRHDVLIGSEISVIGVMVCKFPLERSFTIQRFGKNKPEHGVKSLSSCLYLCQYSTWAYRYPPQLLVLLQPRGNAWHRCMPLLRRKPSHALKAYELENEMRDYARNRLTDCRGVTIWKCCFMCVSCSFHRRLTSNTLRLAHKERISPPNVLSSTALHISAVFDGHVSQSVKA